MTITPIAVYFLYFIFSRPNSQLCTQNDRSNTCLSNEYQPVCALYTGDDCHTTTGFCTQTINSACDACTDDTIIGYTPGECEEPTFPHRCKKSQRGLSCFEDEESEPVCGYSTPHRFRGKDMFAQTLSSCEACSSDQVVFHVPGECQDSSSIGVCRNHKVTKCDEEQAGPLCVYYTGDDCNEEICRKTELNSCNVCQESSVLFYTQGACQGIELPSAEDRVEELILDDAPDQQDLPIPELEAVLQEDGSYVYEEVKPVEVTDDVIDCYVEPQENIPEVEAVLQEDGTTVYELVTPQVEAVSQPEEAIPELEPVIQLDGSIVYEKVESLADKLIEMNPNIPELEAVLQENGSLIYEELKALQSDELVEVDCYVEPQENIPELEAVVQEDGSIVYEEVKVPEEGEEIVDVDCVVEEQDNIPELEAVVQEDGSVVYEEVEATLVNNEEAVVAVEEEEKIEPSQFIVEVIESRFLANEPSN